MADSPASPSKSRPHNIKNLSLSMESSDKPPKNAVKPKSDLRAVEPAVVPAPAPAPLVAADAGSSIAANSNSSSGVFKVPKKILVSDNRELNLRLNSISSPVAPAPGGDQPTAASNSSSSPSMTAGTDSSAGASAVTSSATPGAGAISAPQPTRLNQNTISNLNKSLKAKQKIINSKEPHPKNTTLISEIINTSPLSSVFPNNISSIQDPDNDPTPHPSAPPAPASTTASANTANGSATQLSNVNLPPPTTTGQTSTTAAGSGTSNPLPVSANPDSSNIEPNKDSTPTSKGKPRRIAKQSSTRTDFFAAKLASAVDDIESSDSDETFVYENNNLNDIDTISNAANIAGDNNSIHGSMAGGLLPGGISSGVVTQAGTSMNSPLADGLITNEQYAALSSPNIHRAESVHSHTSKQPVRNAQHINRPPSLANSYNSNHYFDSIMANGKDKKLHSQRSFSSYSNQDETQVKHPSAGEKPSNFHSTLASLNDTHHANHGLGILGNYHKPRSQRTHSINDGYNDEHYSYDEIDDNDENLMDDDISTDGEYYSQRLPDSSNTTVQQQLQKGAESPLHEVSGQEGQEGNQGPHAGEGASDVAENTNNNELAPSIVSKGTSKRYKSSNSSSKLRSTTSKLFDKKGSQPRRYSLIPDDIDIEDFDDELIYYDNNIKFPYSNTSNTNETTSLLNQSHRLPHYRSLNLNFPHSKKLPGLKSKRYLSTGQPLMPTGNDDTTPPRNQIESFGGYPYPDQNQQQQQQQGYYYDIDEFDEEMGPDHNLSKKSSRKWGNGRYTHPRLSPNSTHFLLPRKSSFENYKSHKTNCLKSFIYTLISILIILTIGFIMGFVLATTKDLTNVSITSIENPVVSQDELIVNIVVEALNPGWFTVTIEEVELDLFAKSGYLPEMIPSQDDSMEIEVASNVENVLLGSVYKLETLMSFNGGLFNRDPIDQTAEIKLLSPGKNLTSALSKDDDSEEPDNSKKWEIISKNPFDLIIRGVLKYNLPMNKGTKSVVVNKVGYIDPNSVNGYRFETLRDIVE